MVPQLHWISPKTVKSAFLWIWIGYFFLKRRMKVFSLGLHCQTRWSVIFIIYIYLEEEKRKGSDLSWELQMVGYEKYKQPSTSIFSHFQEVSGRVGMQRTSGLQELTFLYLDLFAVTFFSQDWVKDHGPRLKTYFNQGPRLKTNNGLKSQCLTNEIWNMKTNIT